MKRTEQARRPRAPEKIDSPRCDPRLRIVGPSVEEGEPSPTLSSSVGEGDADGQRTPRQLELIRSEPGRRYGHGAARWKWQFARSEPWIGSETQGPETTSHAGKMRQARRGS
ncbi:hypothetical protein MPTK1_2g07120 [Marchantia polymorpha subsp. ruderalis]